MEDFDKRKASTLANLGLTETDKSPKGSLDTPIIPLLNAINHHPSYYTTSSCSGRISILSTPTSSTVHKKAKGGSWLYITHDFADKDSILQVLFDGEDVAAADEGIEVVEAEGRRCDVVFRFEPLIVAVECRDVAAAQKMVAVAIGCGFRESGITSVGKRVIVGIRCSIRMEVPLGEKGSILASREFVGFLIDVANRKMEANRKRTDGFFQALLAQGFDINETEMSAEFGEGKSAHDEGKKRARRLQCT